MKPTYDAAVKEEVHKRMSPPNRESIPEISRCTGIATSILYSWKRQWRHLSAKLSARGAAPSTAAILLRDFGHAFKVWDRVVINIGPAAKD